MVETWMGKPVRECTIVSRKDVLLCTSVPNAVEVAVAWQTHPAAVRMDKVEPIPECCRCILWKFPGLPSGC